MLVPCIESTAMKGFFLSSLMDLIDICALQLKCFKIVVKANDFVVLDGAHFVQEHFCIDLALSANWYTQCLL